MVKRTSVFILILLFYLVHTPAISADQEKTEPYYPETDPLVLKKLALWQDLKFGLLLHWGPYSQWGVVESWSICSEDEEWCRRNLDNYTEYKKKYEALKKTFNPIRFDPLKWAKAARNAGMKYVVFTTKHHDGFCMFDTRQTDYKVASPNCPFSTNSKADITREIFAAFRREGFMIGAYFSKPDWHSSYYWWPNFATPDRNVNYDIKKYPHRWQKFVEFTHRQIDELMSGYGPIDILWLDGGWVRTLSDVDIKNYINSPDYKFIHIQSQDIDMPAIVASARLKQPGLIVVDRAVPGPHQNYLTPENRIPEKVLPHPWESCITMGRSWSHISDETYKTARELIHILIEIVAKGGNLLLNIGPAPDGTWDEEAYSRLEEIGNWLRVNGSAIYGTRPFPPYKEGVICFTAKNNKTIYAIYLAGPSENQPPVTIDLPPINILKPFSLKMLGNSQPLSCQPDGKGWKIEVPDPLRKNPPCRYAWVFAISRLNNNKERNP